MYAYTHRHRHTYMQTCIHSCMHAYTHKNIDVQMYARVIFTHYRLQAGVVTLAVAVVTVEEATAVAEEVDTEVVEVVTAAPQCAMATGRARTAAQMCSHPKGLASSVILQSPGTRVVEVVAAMAVVVAHVSVALFLNLWCLYVRASHGVPKC